MASITKRGKVWQYRISYYDSDGKRKTINKSGFRTKAEATAEARLTEADLIHGYDLESATTEFTGLRQGPCA